MTDTRSLMPGIAGRLQGLLRILIFAVLAVLLAQCVLISLKRAYSVDEFAYAHGAWLISKGMIPALDFFETKFLLPLWIYSTAFVVGGDDPHLIQALRLLVLPFLGIVLFAVARLAKQVHRMPAGLAALLLATNPAFMNSALEIRPDIVALAFFFGALLLAAQRNQRPDVTFVTGVLFGLSLWSSAKVAIYGAPIALIWALDVVLRNRREAILFARPGWTLLGGLSVIAGVVAYLFLTDSALAFYENAIAHNQKFLLGNRWRPWQDDFRFLATQAPWLHVLFLVGVVSELRRQYDGLSPNDRLGAVLLLLIPSTLAAHSLQLYPFLYSLQPFMAIEAIFAAKGLSLCLAFAFAPENKAPLQRTRILRLAGSAAMLWVAIGVLQTGSLFRELGRDTKSPQHALLEEVERITEPGEPIYDNSGSYVARPNAYFLPWTDAPIRHLWAEKLSREVPLAIEQSDCVIAIIDDRFQGLPSPLKTYILEHFRPHAGAIRVWGRDFTAPDGRVRGRFHANRSGAYRVFPAEIASEGGLSVNGKPIDSIHFSLEEGIHEVEYNGRRGGFRLQWRTDPALTATVVAAK